MTKIKSCASVLVGTALAATVTCCANKPVTLPLVNEERPVVALQPASAMPHVIIYKTTRDYSQNVPVIMDASRQRIVSYPDLPTCAATAVRKRLTTAFCSTTAASVRMWHSCRTPTMNMPLSNRLRQCSSCSTASSTAIRFRPSPTAAADRISAAISLMPSMNISARTD